MEQRSRIAAYAVIRRASSVLLVRASPLSDFPGTWWLPGGGVEHGENPEAAVLREVAEETGLHGRVMTPPRILADTVKIAPLGIDLHTVRVIYGVEIVGGELAVEADGTSDAVAWFETSDLARPEVQDFVRAALDA